MKILMNAMSAHRGGILTYTQTLREKFDQAGIDATVALPKGNHIAGGSLAVTMDVARFSSFQRIIWEQSIWRRYVKASSADVLFSSANFALLNCPIPQLLLMREGGLFNPFYIQKIFPTLGKRVRALTRVRRYFMMQSIKAATVVMLPSETLYDWIRAYCPELADKAVVNTYGINMGRFTPQPPNQIDMTGPLKLLYVSVYYPHKDPETLNRAIQQLRKEGIETTAHITMAEDEFKPWEGGANDYRCLKHGEEEGYLTLKPVDRDDLPKTYGNYNIFIFPSVSETFGFPLAEAMASGLPVIAADSLINREICGPAALYYPSFDSDTLAERIKELRNRPDLYDWLRARGLERAQERFNMTNHFNRLVSILQGMA
jgi:glycosyltransferase involved in cell wall biosynthesis